MGSGYYIVNVGMWGWEVYAMVRPLQSLNYIPVNKKYETRQLDMISHNSS